jgi:hypothetical protein
MFHAAGARNGEKSTMETIRQQQLQDIARTIAEAIWWYSNFTMADAQRLNREPGWTVSDGGYQTGVKLSDDELELAYALGEQLAATLTEDDS